MPCNGVTVATVKIDHNLDDLIKSPDGLKTVSILLKKQGINIEEFVNYGSSITILVDGKNARITQNGLIPSPDVPQKTVDSLKNAFESVAGLISQQKVVAAIKRNTTVISEQTASNGYVVMSVRI